MKNDITKLLADWDYDPEQVNARFVVGEDGRTRIQLRMDLGIFQMEPDGRPDGQRPRGCVSALEHFATLAKTSRAGSFKLDADACAELQQESVQYYYRYLARMQLKDFAGVIEDTRHNLDICELADKHASDDDLKWDFLQFKPYVVMMHYRARAEAFAGAGQIDQAIAAAEQGIAQITSFWTDNQDEDMIQDNLEIDTLRDLIGGYREKRPRNEADEIREELNAAIRNENFEKAAKLRDRLREIERVPASSTGS